ncbi:hypothetical protein ACGFXC_29970 [Streptomyces sp. NPDC048507]|uniref:hypothetical protein n=1 Tax=Streptomyces sp. NPDC048507 TaxID=3365560 RepID=UPI003719D8CD
MKFKLQRMAVVAAAAVVGPSVLMATPAMADEVRSPAVTAPDAEPKGDAAPQAGRDAQDAQAPEGAAKPGAPGGEAGQGKPSGSGAQQAEGQQADGKQAEGQQADGKQAAKSPTMTLTGLPDEFKAGGDWREFALHVDNSGRAAASDYSLELVLWTLDTFSWEGKDIRAEVYAPDAAGTWGWHKIEADGSEEVYSFGVADVDIEANEVFDLKLRMKFADDTPVSRFSLSTTAEGGTADRVRYVSKVTPAAPKSEREGPKVVLRGLPDSGLTADGAWKPLTLSVDNSGKRAFDHYKFTFLFANDVNNLRAQHLQVEVWDGENWVNGGKQAGLDIPGLAFDRAVGKDAKFDIQLRVKVAPDAPLGKAFVVVDAGYDSEIMSPLIFTYTSISAPGTGTGGQTGGGQTGGQTGGNGGTGNTGNQPKPDGGGTTPVVDHGTGTSGSTGTAGTGSGGQLAATGSDPATTWALGGAGVALAMGAALVAGTGKRRRTTA